MGLGGRAWQGVRSGWETASVPGGAALGRGRVPAEAITVMFTDLVGSTAMLSRVGEERAETLRREHFSLLRGALGTCGGREVKTLGDGLMVVFGSLGAAIDAGVLIQQRLDARNQRAEEPLIVRIG